MLNLRQIEAFRAVIQTGTVSRAAQRLSISQPAVSKLIQNLEHSVGLRLFERTPGRVVPTAEALLLSEEIERIFRGLESLQTFVGDIRILHRSSLRIGVMPALSTGFIQDILADFMEAYPQTQVAVHARSTMKIVEWLVAGNIDVGVSSHPVVNNPELLQISLHQSPYVCVLPKDHRLARKAALEPRDLENERFISFSPESDMRKAIDQIFEAAGIRRQLLIEAAMAPTVCALVARGLGVALLNPLYLGGFSESVICRPFSPTVQSDIRILLPRHRPHSLVTKAFVETAHAHVGRLTSHNLPLSRGKNKEFDALLQHSTVTLDKTL
jgi:DNA-binding transcriptional LysR family regulator